MLERNIFKAMVLNNARDMSFKEEMSWGSLDERLTKKEIAERKKRLIKRDAKLKGFKRNILSIINNIEADNLSEEDALEVLSELEKVLAKKCYQNISEYGNIYGNPFSAPVDEVRDLILDYLPDEGKEKIKALCQKPLGKS